MTSLGASNSNNGGGAVHGDFAPWNVLQTTDPELHFRMDSTATGFYVIDFNLAYNPTCAYNPTWECPYPPASNRLKVAISAGEKAPPEASAAKASGA